MKDAMYKDIVGQYWQTISIQSSSNNKVTLFYNKELENRTGAYRISKDNL